MENLSSMICSVADKNDIENDIESSEDEDDGPGFRSIPLIKSSDKTIRSKKNKMSYASNLSMSTIMQTNPHPVNFIRNHDILSIKEWRRFVDTELYLGS